MRDKRQYTLLSLWTKQVLALLVLLFIGTSALQASSSAKPNHSLTPSNDHKNIWTISQDDSKHGGTFQDYFADIEEQDQEEDESNEEDHRSGAKTLWKDVAQALRARFSLEQSRASFSKAMGSQSAHVSYYILYSELRINLA